MKELIAKEHIDVVKEKLQARQETLAVAESATSGVLQAVCSAATEAALFFQGGITVYNLGQKTLHLSVEPIQAQQCNCVSAKTAAQMAVGVCQLFKSDWGIAITGYASPVPESQQQIFAYCAIAYKGAVVSEQKITPVASDFFAVQLEYATQAVEMLLSCL